MKYGIGLGLKGWSYFFGLIFSRLSFLYLEIILPLRLSHFQLKFLFSYLQNSIEESHST